MLTKRNFSVESLEKRAMMTGDADIFAADHEFIPHPEDGCFANQPLVTFDDFILPGDANRDGQFDTTDLVEVLRGGKFRTNEPATWQEGDFNNDDLFDTTDLLEALKTGVYNEGPYIDDGILDFLAAQNATQPTPDLGALGSPGDYQLIEWQNQQIGQITYFPQNGFAMIQTPEGAADLNGHWDWNPEIQTYTIIFENETFHINGVVDTVTGDLVFDWMFDDGQTQQNGSGVGQVTRNDPAPAARVKATTNTNYEDRFTQEELDEAKKADVEIEVGQKSLALCGIYAMQALLAFLGPNSAPTVSQLINKASSEGMLEDNEAHQPASAAWLPHSQYVGLAALFGWNVNWVSSNNAADALQKLRDRVNSGQPVWVSFDVNRNGDPIKASDYQDDPNGDESPYTRGEHLHAAVVQGFITKDGVEYVIVKQPWLEGTDKPTDRVWRVDEFVHAWGASGHRMLVATGKK